MIALTDKIQVDLMVRVLACHIKLGHAIGLQPADFPEWERHLLIDIFHRAAELAASEMNGRMN